ncbi:MAG: hypothetical protein KGI33_09965 [Thaumarchaeota archaeon]|nr:hypothetical protein [Nitrososphaerota archaeon]
MDARIMAGMAAAILMVPLMVQYAGAHGLSAVRPCTEANLAYNTELYREDINGLNEAASLYVEDYPHYTMGNLAAYMVNVYLFEPVELAHCLRDFGVNPGSVAHISPLAYNALAYDKANLKAFAPDFLREIPAPQEGR